MGLRSDYSDELSFLDYAPTWVAGMQSGSVSLGNLHCFRAKAYSVYLLRKANLGTLLSYVLTWGSVIDTEWKTALDADQTFVKPFCLHEQNAVLRIRTIGVVFASPSEHQPFKYTQCNPQFILQLCPSTEKQLESVSSKRQLRNLFPNVQDSSEVGFPLQCILFYGISYNNILSFYSKLKISKVKFAKN